MRSIKLLAVLAVTVLLYLVLLHFKIPFGIALVIALAFMWAGVKYVRTHDSEAEAPEEQGPAEDGNGGGSE